MSKHCEKGHCWIQKRHDKNVLGMGENVLSESELVCLIFAIVLSYCLFKICQCLEVVVVARGNFQSGKLAEKQTTSSISQTLHDAHTV